MELTKAKDWIIANHTKTIAITRPDNQEYDMVSGTFDNIKSIIKEAQKNAIEVAIEIIEESGDEYIHSIRTNRCGDKEYYIDAEECKENLFKIIDNE